MISVLIIVLHAHAASHQLDTSRVPRNQRIDSVITKPNGYIDVPAPSIAMAKDTSVQITITRAVASSDLPRGAKDTTNLNFKDTDLRDIFRAMSVQHGLNIFLDNSINKRTTIALSKVQVYNAIKFLCEQNSVLLNYEGGIFKIEPPPPPPKPEPPPPKIPIVSYEGHLLSVQLKDDDLEKTILEIQRKTGLNILSMNGTTGTLTGTLNKLEFDVGFTQLMNNNGFAVQKKQGIYLVSRQDYFVGGGQGNQSQSGGPYWVSVKDSLVTVDVTNAPLDRVIPDMIRQLNTDVVFYNPLSGNITLRATNIPLSRALTTLLRNTNYSYRQSDGLYFIGEKTNKALSVTKLLKLKYLRAEKIADMIPQSITSQALVKPVKEHNGFVVIGSNDAIDEMQNFLDQVDKPVAQVLIEALVVDYDLTNGKEFSLQVGWLGKSDTTGIARSGSIIVNCRTRARLISWATILIFPSSGIFQAIFSYGSGRLRIRVSPT